MINTDERILRALFELCFDRVMEVLEEEGSQK